MAAQLFMNGKIFNSAKKDGEPIFWDWMLVQNKVIKDIGLASDGKLQQYTQASPDTLSHHDLQKKTVLPGFIDGHMHLLMLGQSLLKLDLWGCKNLDDIRSRIRTYAAQNPDVPRILCKGWMNFMSDGKALASMLDDLDPLNRPIFIDSRDLHSTWCNSAGLKDMDVEGMEVPPGGLVERDETGKPSGLLGEACVLTHVWPHLARVASMDEKVSALKGAMSCYTEAGYTGVVDMAMDENAWEAILHLFKEDPDVPVRVSAYWFMAPTDDLQNAYKQIEKAAEMARQFNAETSPKARILGIKIILDGVIDACRAAVSHPYTSTGELPDALWKAEIVDAMVKHADGLGLQCAVHAIGDAAITMAINAISTGGTPGKRHRIEHLELSSPEDARRLGELGITASIQPVHSDPAILRAWPGILGSQRLKRAFAYREFWEHGAPLAIGTDAPTAPHPPFPNFYVATTRKSAKEPTWGDEPVNPEYVLDVYDTLAGATAGVAYSTHSEDVVGSLKVGYHADFVVVDLKFEEPESLLETKGIETWFEGRKVFG